jgi:regulator of protease activity HflC (stomatin/prohibitin superfamily)
MSAAEGSAAAPLPPTPPAPAQDLPPPRRPGRWRRLQAWLQLHRVGIALFFLVTAFILVAFWDFIMVPKRSGEQGVYWSRFFGGTSDFVLGEGTHAKLPWDEIIVYDVRLSQISSKTVLLTRDGMEINVEWSVRYRPKQNQLPLLHKTIGPDYAKTVIVPETVSALRQIIGNYTAEQIYSRDEDSLIAEIQKATFRRMAPYPIEMENLLILRLDLPPDMAKSIVEKLVFEQTLLAYRFRNEAEEQEKRRKLIEAEGIRDFEATSRVSALKWKGLDVTRDIAKSPNAKIVIMGSGGDQMPLLLNADK